VNSVEDYELAEHLTGLSELHAQEPPLDPLKQEDLIRYELTRAWRQGFRIRRVENDDEGTRRGPLPYGMKMAVCVI
jgi:hypothetical protein